MIRDLYTKNEIADLLPTATIPTTDGTRDFFTKTETDTIINSVPSGGSAVIVENGFFTDQKKFILPYLYDRVETESFEIVVCFRLVAQPTNVQPFFGSVNSHYFFSGSEANATGLGHAFSNDGLSWTYGATIPWADTPMIFGNSLHWIRVAWSSAANKQILSFSNDAETWTTINELTTTGKPYSPLGGSYIMLGGAGSDQVFTGGNDVNIFNSYLKINGVLVWGAEI